jgi:hypothetical protein
MHRGEIASFRGISRRRHFRQLLVLDFEVARRAPMQAAETAVAPRLIDQRAAEVSSHGERDPATRGAVQRRACK